MSFAIFYGILGKALILGACAMGGKVLADEFKHRRDNLRDFKSVITDMKNEISYRSSTVEEIVEKIGDEAGNGIQKIFYSLALRRKERKCRLDSSVGFGDDMYELFDDSRQSICFKENDMLIVRDFADGIGTTNSDGQEQLLDGVLSSIDVNLESAADDADRKGKMYMTLGISLGILIVIMVV